MSNWGLLGGLGRGLSQFGATLNQGMAADITAERRQRVEDMRLKSQQERWAVEDKRYNERQKESDRRMAVEDKRYNERQKESDRRWDVAQKQQQQDRENTASYRQDQLDLSRDKMGARERERAVSSIDSALASQQKSIMEAIDAMREQGLPEAEVMKEAQRLQGQFEQFAQRLFKANPTYAQGSYFYGMFDAIKDENNPSPDVNTDVIPKGQSSAGAVSQEEILKDIFKQNTSAPSAKPEANNSGGLLNAFIGGIDTGSGGFYNGDNVDYDTSNYSRLESLARGTGEAIARPTGVVGDAAQLFKEYGYDPAADWLNERPNQRK